MGARRVFPGIVPGQKPVSRAKHIAGLRGGRVGGKGYAGLRNQMEALERNIAQAILEIEDAVPDALQHGVQEVFDLSQTYVPVKTGELKASGFILARKTRRGASAVVGYAAASRPSYALPVHEIMEAYHEPPTQAKFLQAALEQAGDGIEDRIVEYMRGLTGD